VLDDDSDVALDLVAPAEVGIEGKPHADLQSQEDLVKCMFAQEETVAHDDLNIEDSSDD